MVFLENIDFNKDKIFLKRHQESPTLNTQKATKSGKIAFQNDFPIKPTENIE